MPGKQGEERRRYNNGLQSEAKPPSSQQNLSSVQERLEILPAGLQECCLETMAVRDISRSLLQWLLSYYTHKHRKYVGVMSVTDAVGVEIDLKVIKYSIQQSLFNNFSTLGNK